MPSKITRRTLLLGGGAAVAAATTAGALVATGHLPGRRLVDTALHRCDVRVAPPRTAPGPAVDGSFASARRGRDVAYRLVYPPGSAPGDALPVCLVLHGLGSDATGAINAGRYDGYLADAVAAGVRPFALAAMDGGTGYWHPHPTDDPLGALLDEFLPLLATRGLGAPDPREPSSPRRAAVLGWSMGGYGALLAAVTAPDRFAAVVANAPAFWRSYDEARRVNRDAFDSPDEWRRYDILSRARELDGQRLYIACGESDPFAPATTELRNRLPDRSVVHLVQGCHDGAFWQHVAPAQIRFLGEALMS